MSGIAITIWISVVIKTWIDERWRDFKKPISNHLKMLSNEIKKYSKWK